MEYLKILEAYEKIENIVKFHNKNLTKKQYFALEDSMELLKKEIDNYQKELDDNLPF